jgi:hypothetical protein
MKEHKKFQVTNIQIVSDRNDIPSTVMKSLPLFFVLIHSEKSL